MRNYSLGMRQRLGIANALLGDPSVLILDEPVNGLDPAGIHWMRGLLRQFAAQGGTVLLSSHLLHEVEMIADEMVLIGRGKIVAQGTKAELLQTRGTYVKPEDPGALLQALQGAGIEAIPSGDGGFRSEVEPVDVGRAAAAAGVVLVELKPRRGRRPRGDVPPAHLRRRPRGHHRRRSPGMNTTAPHGSVAPGTLDLTADKPVPLGRLVKVEMRKMLDTRAGMWLIIAIVAITALITVIFFFAARRHGPDVHQLHRRDRQHLGLPAAGARHPAGHPGVEPAHRRW